MKSKEELIQMDEECLYDLESLEEINDEQKERIRKYFKNMINDPNIVKNLGNGSHELAKVSLDFLAEEYIKSFEEK